MADQKIEDGTWTLRVTWHKAGIWRTIIFKPSVTDSRFRRARFVLVDGPTVLVSADDLRRIVEQKLEQLRPGGLACPLSIDPVASTINKQKVDLSIEN
jgi:hypothetical protein